MPFWKKKKPESEPKTEQTPEVIAFEPRVLLPNTDYIIDLFTKQRMIWIDTPHPWRFNGDDEYLTQLDYDSATGNFLDLRTAMASAEDYDFNWYKRFEKRYKPEQREAIEELINEILSPKLFNFWSYQELLQRVIHTGMEGINIGWKEYDGLISPCDIQHIDNRRFMYYRCDPATGEKLEDQENDEIPFVHILYLKQPGTMQEIPLYKLKNGKQIPVYENLQILINRPYEYTLGYGRAEVGKIYWDFRTRAFMRQFTQVSIDKFMLPFIFLTKDPKTQIPLTHDGKGVASIPTLQALEGIGQKINESRSATCIAISHPVQATLLDIAGNKISEMREWDKYYVEQMGNGILGSSAMLQTKTKTYGATQSQTKVSHFYIMQDRKFKIDIINRVLMPQVFEKNRRAFEKIGVKSWRHMPDISFLSEEIDITEQMEKLKTAKEAASEDMRIVPEEIEKQLDIKLEKDVNLDNPEPNESQNPAKQKKAEAEEEKKKQEKSKVYNLTDDKEKEDAVKKTR